MKKTAVIGFGFMGMAHAVNILKNPDFQLKAIVDINPDQIGKNLLATAGNLSTGSIDPSRFDNIGKYASLDDCLSSEELDAVNICTHVNLHYEMTKNALLHDKHVFLEKPFCLDPAQAAELVSLARERKKTLMVGHVVRFMPPWQQLKRWIESGEFGKLRFLSLSRFCGLPSWGQWQDKNVRELSGGALFDLVIHDIDFSNYAAGMPDSIESTCLPGPYTNHDYVSAIWSYKDSDLHVKIEGGFTFHSSFPFQASYMAAFDEVSILYTTLNGSVIQIADSKGIREVPAGDGADGYYNEISYFGTCLKEGKDTVECSPESSLEAIELCYKHIK
jgi:predicted dehydrogenase